MAIYSTSNRINSSILFSQFHSNNSIINHNVVIDIISGLLMTLFMVVRILQSCRKWWEIDNTKRNSELSSYNKNRPCCIICLTETLVKFKASLTVDIDGFRWLTWPYSLVDHFYSLCTSELHVPHVDLASFQATKSMTQSRQEAPRNCSDIRPKVGKKKALFTSTREHMSIVWVPPVSNYFKIFFRQPVWYISQEKSKTEYISLPLFPGSTRQLSRNWRAPVSVRVSLDFNLKANHIFPIIIILLYYFSLVAYPCYLTFLQAFSSLVEPIVHQRHEGRDESTLKPC